MTRARFSQVIRGARGDAAKNKYLDHLRGEGQGENIGTRGNRPAEISLYITPFALPLGSTVVIQCSALEPAYNLFKDLAAFNTRANFAVPADHTAVKLNSYRAPRVIRRAQNSTQGAVATSKLTGLKYLKYNTTTNSVPFGKKTGDTTPFTAFSEIAAAAKGQSTSLKFTFQEERV